MLGGAIFGAEGLLGGLIEMGDVTASCKECGHEWDL